MHADARNAAGELAQIYVQSGRAGEAADIYARLVARAGAEGHAEHAGTAHLLANQGFILIGMGRAEEGEAAFERAISLYETHGDMASDAYRQTLEAWLDRLVASKRASKAAAKARVIIPKLVAHGAPGIPLALSLHDRLSQAALEAGRADEARGEAVAALALIESAGAALPEARPGRVDPRVTALNNLARAYRAEANLDGAEKAYRRAISLLEASGDRINAGVITDNLAVLYLSHNRLDDAERHHKKALTLLEAALGREHVSVGRVAGNLGTLLSEAGRYGEAEPLLRRALAIGKAQAKPDAVWIGTVSDNLAGLLRESGRAGEALGLYEQALASFEKALPATHPRLATARNNLGRFLIDKGEFALAETELKRALAMSEEIYGRDSFQIAVPAANLAEALAAKGERAQARGLLSRALTVLEAAYGPSHAKLLVTLNAAGRLEIADGRPAEARALFERAVAIALQERNRSEFDGADGRGTRWESRRALVGLLDALWSDGAGHVARAVEVAQWNTMTSSAVALAALGARAASGDPALGSLARERQDLSAEWLAADKRLIQLLAQSGDRDSVQEAALRERLSAIEARIAGIDEDLARRFPRYQELARPSPLTVDGLQRLMSPGEAAVQIVVTAQATYVLAVTDRETRWHRAPIRERELQSLVRNLRCGLDRAEWEGSGLKRCTTLLGLDPSAAPGPEDPLPFDITGAHALYRILLAPLEGVIAGKDLLVVASGPLSALPLHVLVTQMPEARAGQADRLLSTNVAQVGRVAWLGRRHAVTVLPSLASLGPLRQYARTSAARSPYLGIGNPLLTGPEGTDRRAFEVADCAIAPVPPLRANAIVGAAGNKSRVALPVALRATTQGVERLRRQWPLPETAAELCRVASYARATPADVLTGAAATEVQLKRLSASGRLAEARIVHFATHGLLAGETALFAAGKAEPSLMLTPPDATSEEDDGLLMASEVAALKLDADWVILSACNTASGEEIGAEALSGLARAFFYAGARSLLVSHWAVDSDATVRLITSVFEAMAREPGLTQGQALSRAMAALLDGGGREAHPANWAPFVVVGGSASIAGLAVSKEASVASMTAASAVPPVAKALVKKSARNGDGVAASEAKRPFRPRPASARRPAKGDLSPAPAATWPVQSAGQ